MEIQVSREMAVSPARVMRALTEPVEVAQWAGAELLLDESTFQMKGSSFVTGALGGRLLGRTATSLRFEWVVKGEVTEAEIQVKALPQLGNPPAEWSEVTVIHRGIPAGVFALHEKGTWECVWILLLRYLRSWVERAERPGLFNFDGPFPAVVEREVLLEAPSAKAWRALMEPELRRRWMGDEMGQILAQVDGRSVTFAWPEVPGSEVTISLEPLGPERTRLVLRHLGLPEAGLTYHLGWYDYLVAGFLEISEPLIGRAVWLGAPPERVWPLIATQEGLRQWFNKGIEFDPAPGGQVSFQAHGGRLYGEIVSVEPGRRVSFTWSEEGVEWPAPTLLTMELIPEAGGTLLKITHSGFGPLPPQEYDSYRRGWADDSWVAESLLPLITA